MTACWRCTAEAGHAPFEGSFSVEGESPPLFFIYFFVGSRSLIVNKTQYAKDCDIAILVNLVLLLLFAAAVISPMFGLK
jgi:hypothetical protein